MLAATFALSTTAGAAGVLALDAAIGSAKADEAAPHPDAALLAYAPRLAALQAETDRLDAEVRRTNGILDAMTVAAPEPHDPFDEEASERWVGDCKASGYTAAQDAFDEAVGRMNDVLDEIAEIPAVTLDGLCLKARYGHEYEDLIESIVADLVALDRRAQA